MENRILTTCIIAGILLALSMHSVYAETITNTDTVIASQDGRIQRYDKSDRVYKKLEDKELRIASYFYQRRIGQVIVEKDFVRYQFDVDTGEIIDKTERWRKDLPDRLPPIIPQEEAESLVEGVVQFSKLRIISPDSNVYPINPTPKNPCWIVRSTTDERIIVTIIDAVTGRKLGHGIPPPSEGYSLSGPQPEDVNDCSDPWEDWYEGARDWFNSMGYPTTAHEFPMTATIQNYIQSDRIAMFYELAHGGSWDFRNGCPERTRASDIETWLDDYASVAFAFLGSCEGMCFTSDNSLSHEFRKGSTDGTVTVGYCHMYWPRCDDCWEYSVSWQNELFNHLRQGHTAGYAFSQANLAYPDCAGTNNCMRIAGDTDLTVVPVVTRSLCGSVYDGLQGPLTMNSRDHYIRCGIYVPDLQILTIDPGVDLVFLNDSKVTSNGIVNANGTAGRIRFISEKDSSKGMEFTGQLRMMNGGQIRIYE